jgi:sugar lactone lactonase YvrE
MPGLVAARDQGLVVGLEDGLYGFDPIHGLGARLVPVEAEDPRTRINDGKVDREGRLWFGTMDKTGSAQEEFPMTR